MDAVTAAGQEGKAGAGLFLALRLGQYPAAGGDHRIARQDESAQMARGYCRRFFGGQAARVVGGQLARKRAFIDIGGIDGIGRHADLREQIKATGRCGSKDQAHGSGFVMLNLSTSSRQACFSIHRLRRKSLFT
jgi:hypothetical protein